MRNCWAREVVGRDIEIREHNRKAIEAHLLAQRPLDRRLQHCPATIVQCAHAEWARRTSHARSNHTYHHALAELNALRRSGLRGSYCVVFDTRGRHARRLRMAAVTGARAQPQDRRVEWIKQHPEFEIDCSVEDRLLVTSAPDGFLRRKA